MMDRRPRSRPRSRSPLKRRDKSSPSLSQETKTSCKGNAECASSAVRPSDGASVTDLKLKDGFHRVELKKEVWEVPVRYQTLSHIGYGAYGQVVYMVMPLMGADLDTIIRTQRLSDDHIQYLVYQILRGLKYIHSAGIIHRDLKPGNLGVTEDCELKILDFGLARHGADTMTGYVVTRWYRAPEILLDWMKYNNSIDIWSVGCIMAEMITGKPLFPGTDHIDQLKKILQFVGTPDERLFDKITSNSVKKFIRSLPVMRKKDFKEVFTDANPEAVDLLERMLDLDTDSRISATEALAHPYLKQYADPQDEPTAQPYDQSFENFELTIPEWKSLVYKEVVSFVPLPDPSLVQSCH